MTTIARILLVLALWTPETTFGWGPHWHITRAAIEVLGTKHPLAAQLGAELLPLTNYCWLPDYKRIPFRVPEQDFYADDYLLFPGVTKHYDHICPEVEKTYEPYFRRALQALRTESPANAARWTGSILHFVQDTGSPPHAAQVRGDLHSKMENWVDASKISIPGYEPRLLGTNENDAVRGLVERMNGLIEFSKLRAQRMRTPVLLANRRTVEPIALESALECARVSADVLHTLATLAADSPARGFEIGGTIRARAAVSDGRFPAKMMLNGTNVSTLADEAGRFFIRGLQAGKHPLSIIQPGSEILETNLVVNGPMTNLVFQLRPNGNLVRNGDFRWHWVATNAPDCWTKMSLSWEGEVIALQNKQRYRVRADFQPASEAEVVVRWSSEQPFIVPKPAKAPPIQTRRLTPSAPEFFISGSSNAALMQLVIRATGHPTNELRRLSVTPSAD
jgi:hypothetical protein